MSDPRFLQGGFDKQLAHLVEECGEVLAAAGKTQRWGLDSVNPLLPAEQQETNRDWLFREIVDLDQAIGRLLATMGRDRSSALLLPEYPEDLRPWGYAPGSYVFKCQDCPADLDFYDKMGRLGDKRSTRCEEHARAARDVSNHAAMRVNSNGER